MNALALILVFIFGILHRDHSHFLHQLAATESRGPLAAAVFVEVFNQPKDVQIDSLCEVETNPIHVLWKEQVHFRQLSAIQRRGAVQYSEVYIHEGGKHFCPSEMLDNCPAGNAGSLAVSDVHDGEPNMAGVRIRNNLEVTDSEAWAVGGQEFAFGGSGGVSGKLAGGEIQKSGHNGEGESYGYERKGAESYRVRREPISAEWMWMFLVGGMFGAWVGYAYTVWVDWYLERRDKRSS